MEQAQRRVQARSKCSDLRENLFRQSGTIERNDNSIEILSRPATKEGDRWLDDQNRNIRPANQIIGNASQSDSRDSAARVTRHDDEVGLESPGIVAKCRGDSSILERGDDSYLAQHPALGA